MLGLPATTEFDRPIPKKKFYENLSITTALRETFTNQIDRIYWRNKIAPETLNVTPGEQVTELEVFEIRLKTPKLDEAVLRLIDRELPYHILYVLTYDGRAQAWIGCKHAATSGSSTFKVDGYFHTDWTTEEGLAAVLKPDGLTTDALYESYVRRIAGEKLLPPVSAEESLWTTMERTKARDDLAKRVERLRAKIRKEKQFNRQAEMNAELKRLKRELAALDGSMS